ncbi:hypothetical protein ColLi_13279 [Colletotrichum liriopes]|uniref:Uncharacterized protein n=1 Tax=Colletotrichum liriopes TaxID=708192 RepID=A0AA37H1W7_9PEZI|nr:hypothetical protein ColLi_13279 [Colletotrichum liriopes]
MDPSCVNELVGTFVYHYAGQSTEWEFGASNQELNLDVLYEVLKDIALPDMDIKYENASGKYAFVAIGIFSVDSASLDLTYERSAEGWHFKSSLSSSEPHNGSEDTKPFLDYGL